MLHDLLNTRCLSHHKTSITLYCLCPAWLQSDPMAVVYVKKRNGTLEELGRTEVIMNSLEPFWIQKIMVTYQFEIVQHLV